MGICVSHFSFGPIILVRWAFARSFINSFLLFFTLLFFSFLLFFFFPLECPTKTVCKECAGVEASLVEEFCAVITDPRVCRTQRQGERCGGWKTGLLHDFARKARLNTCSHSVWCVRVPVCVCLLLFVPLRLQCGRGLAAVAALVSLLPNQSSDHLLRRLVALFEQGQWRLNVCVRACVRACVRVCVCVCVCLSVCL